MNFQRQVRSDLLDDPSNCDRYRLDIAISFDDTGQSGNHSGKLFLKRFIWLLLRRSKAAGSGES